MQVGWTPLHNAVHSMDATELLLRWGANVNAIAKVALSDRCNDDRTKC